MSNKCEIVSRTDASGRLDKAKRTSIGGAYIPARLSRVGVLMYHLPNGSVRRELRHPDEIFKADSLATLDSVPVIDIKDHRDLLSPDDYRRATVGHVKSFRVDGKFISGELVVQDGATLDAIDSGERVEISCGYRCRLDMTPGTFNGEAYDCVQRDIQYNHVALCPPNRGRAGPEVSLRLDQGDGTALPPKPTEIDVDWNLLFRKAEHATKMLNAARVRMDATIPARRNTSVSGGVDLIARTVPIVASTPNPVRRVNEDGTTVDESLTSWSLERFAKNPVVLWAHDSLSLPIGRAEAFEQTPDGLKMLIRFATAAANPLAELVLRAVAEGVVSAVSVGFEPGFATVTKGADGVDLVSRSNNVLLELSFVAVPADEDAGTGSVNPAAERSRVSSAARDLALHGARQRAAASSEPEVEHTDAEELDVMMVKARAEQLRIAANASKRAQNGGRR